jgi:hypothetical protein
MVQAWVWTVTVFDCLLALQWRAHSGDKAKPAQTTQSRSLWSQNSWSSN